MTEWFARPVLHVSNVEASLRFYVDRLGFTVPWRVEVDGHVDVAQVDRLGCALILCQHWSEKVGKGLMSLMRSLIPLRTGHSRARNSALATLVVLALNSPVAHTQWLNHPTPGIPRLPDGKPNLAAPISRTSDGKPDLTGIWVADCAIYGRDACFLKSLFFNIARDLKPEDVVMTPWAAAIQKQRESRNHIDDPYGYCLPPGVPRINFAGAPFKIIQTPQLTVFLHETLVGMIFRQVFTDGRVLPPIGEPTWLGYSVGRWDDDVFVVETTGFRDAGWLDTQIARPHSDALRVTERFRRVDFGHIELAVTIDDPKAYRQPWTVTTRLNLLPDTELIEAFCENHAQTMEHRVITPPLPEPPSVSPSK